MQNRFSINTAAGCHPVGPCPVFAVSVIVISVSVTVSRPRKQHEVEAVGSIPLGLVQRRPLLHQVLQVLGVHLQPPHHVVHVALVVLVVYFTIKDVKKIHVFVDGPLF